MGKGQCQGNKPSDLVCPCESIHMLHLFTFQTGFTTKKKHGSRLQTSFGGQMLGAIVPKLILIVLYWLFKLTLIMDFILSNNGLIHALLFVHISTRHQNKPC